ncbi:hypothetical protein JN531_012615 [Flagellatimonas centrodinii]|uniref:hypothetical protein n=1 Tax=Flagellatimonas centrodinii TaxID=2806210 RepID=UPI001FEF1ADA|nr:hypothetical protein [Flagellatimonas centrodinii]ULQ45942.1 hypothetical protein JN531_012615 [Flagellatimonas centrodinii]
MITGGFGTQFDIERGAMRSWAMGRDGQQRWTDTGAVVGCDHCQGAGVYQATDGATVCCVCMPRTCRVCGCTNDDCRQCIQRTGEPCHWVNTAGDICSACYQPGTGA